MSIPVLSVNRRLFIGLFYNYLSVDIPSLFNQTRMKLIAYYCLLLLTCLLSCKFSEGPGPDASSTNPDDCVLTKVNYAQGTYDEFSYDSRGLITSIQSYQNNAKLGLYTNTYDADGKLTGQNLNGFMVQYVYSGNTLNKIQLVNSGVVLGEYAVTFDGSGRISNLNVQNTQSPLSTYEGYNSTFTYDGQGNCTLIELKDKQSRLLSRTVYSDFVAVRSHVTKFKNQYINPYTATVTENLQYVLPYKFPSTAPNKVELYSAIDLNGNYTGSLTKQSEEVYQRTANQSGMQIQRTSTFTASGSTSTSTTTFEYTGCQ